MKKLVMILIALVVVAGAIAVAAEGNDGVKRQRDGSAPTLQARVAQGGNGAGGPGETNMPITIRYDPGAPQDLFRALSGAIDVVGNVFNSHLTGPLKAATITAVSFFPNAVGGDFTLSFIGPPAGTVAVLYQYINFSGVANGVFNSAALGTLAQPVGTSFLVGAYLGTFNGPDSVGMRTASYAGQGFHAFQGDFLGGATVASISTIAGENAMIRASGPLGVPVELMNFTIE